MQRKPFVQVVVMDNNGYINSYKDFPLTIEGMNELGAYIGDSILEEKNRKINIIRFPQ